ncbi:hypothetical protein Tco_0682079 [Tanacetum coccineum]|uniref:Uncharacterized protein n=1 Tax=Tanacetum coccineum TaxID=301880 RepID=A0ABQ4XQ78_9ASTR
MMIKNPSLETVLEGPIEERSEQIPESPCAFSKRKDTTDSRKDLLQSNGKLQYILTGSLFGGEDDDILYKFKDRRFSRLRIEDIEDMIASSSARNS